MLRRRQVRVWPPADARDRRQTQSNHVRVESSQLNRGFRSGSCCGSIPHVGVVVFVTLSLSNEIKLCLKMVRVLKMILNGVMRMSINVRFLAIMAAASLGGSLT